MCADKGGCKLGRPSLYAQSALTIQRGMQTGRSLPASWKLQLRGSM